MVIFIQKNCDHTVHTTLKLKKLDYSWLDRLKYNLGFKTQLKVTENKLCKCNSGKYELEITLGYCIGTTV